MEGKSLSEIVIVTCFFQTILYYLIRPKEEKDDV